MSKTNWKGRQKKRLNKTALGIAYYGENLF